MYAWLPECGTAITQQYYCLHLENYKQAYSDADNLITLTVATQLISLCQV
jgi:hypothetical protein